MRSATALLLTVIAASLFGLRPAQALDAPLQQALEELQSRLPVPGTLINNPDAATWHSSGRTQSGRVIDAPGVVGGKAYRVKVHKAGEHPWHVLLRGPLRGGMKKDDVILLAYWARAPIGDRESQSGLVSLALVEEMTRPHRAAVRSSALVPSGWKLFYAAGTAPLDLTSDQAHVTFHLGGQEQTLDFGPYFVLNLGPNVALSDLPRDQLTYPGREANAAWRLAAEERIERIRKDDLKILVADEAGRPVPGATVRVEMKRHEFRFGAFIGRRFLENSPDGANMRRSFPELFNYATTPIFWQDWGWMRPDKRQIYMDQIEWLHENAVRWRGHTLIYPEQKALPKRFLNLVGNRPALRRAVFDHVEEVTRFAGRHRPDAIDVVNEPRTGEYLTEVAGDDVVAEAFGMTARNAPTATRFVNDNAIITSGGRNDGNIDYYHRWLDDMKRRGASVGGIGFQGHFGAVLTGPARVVEIFDEFWDRHRLPIHITEFDINALDEETQADYTRDLLTAVFSHPAGEAFIVWGWWEGDHWRPTGAMMRKDWSPKPNYHAWRNRIFRDWWTRAEKRTGADGTVGVRGFHGLYDVTVTTPRGQITRRIELGRGGKAVKLVVK